MIHKVIWSESAYQDIEKVRDYISKDSPSYAATFARMAVTSAKSLGAFPERGRVVPELGDRTIREIFVRRYRLIYQIRDRSVYILGFIHGARDLLGVWKDEKR